MRLALVCAIAATLCIQSTAQPPRPTPPPPIAAPPQPLRIAIKVTRDEPVEIPLGIYGTRSQTLEFKIRVRPATGQLSEPKQVGQEAAVVTYTAPPDLAISNDQFSYSVRSREGVSAPSVVQIAIIDEPPILAGPALVEFGRMMAGEKSVQTIEISNAGGGLAEGGGQQEGGSEERARAAAQGLTAIREVGVQRLQGLGLFGQRTGVHRA